MTPRTRVRSSRLLAELIFGSGAMKLILEYEVCFLCFSPVFGRGLDDGLRNQQGGLVQPNRHLYV